MFIVASFVILKTNINPIFFCRLMAYKLHLMEFTPPWKKHVVIYTNLKGIKFQEGKVNPPPSLCVQGPGLEPQHQQMNLHARPWSEATPADLPLGFASPCIFSQGGKSRPTTLWLCWLRFALPPHTGHPAQFLDPMKELYKRHLLF